MRVVLWDGCGSVVVRDRILYSECEMYSIGSCGGWMLWKAEEPLWYGKIWFTGGGPWGYIAQPYFLSTVCILNAETMWSVASCSCLSYHDGLQPLKNKTFLSYVILLWQKDILMPHLYCLAFCYCNKYLSQSAYEEKWVILAHSLQGSGPWAFCSVALGLCWGNLSWRRVCDRAHFMARNRREGLMLTSRDLSLGLAF